MKNKIIILSLIVICSILYIVLFDYYVDNYVDTEPKGNYTEALTSNVTVDKVIKFIDENDIDYLDGFNKDFNVYELTNQNKLLFIYYALKDEVDFNSGVSHTRFNSYNKLIFGDDATIKNENILVNKEIMLMYDSINEVYKYPEDMITYDLLSSSYNYVVDFEVYNNQYLLTVNKFFIQDDNVYSSIDELKNKENALFSVVEIEDKKQYIKEYITKNYRELKDNLYKYRYEFSKEDGNLILIRYQKLKKEKEMQKN